MATELIQNPLYNIVVKKITKQHRLASLVVVISLLGIYFLSYSGMPVSDDEQLFAAASQSISQGKGMQAPQLYGNDRLLGKYTRSGPLHVLVGAALLRTISSTGVGQVQAVYLLPPIYTALTAALIVLIVSRYGFSLLAGLFSAFAFGLTSIAWPYSQMNFREPLAMLLLTCTWLLLLKALDYRGSPKRIILYLGAGTLVFLSVLLTKVLLLAVLPAFLYLVWSEGGSASWKRVFAGILIVLLIVAIPQFFPQSRLSLHFFERLWRIRRGFPYSEIPTALLEMLFAPGRGLLVYVPVLWLLPLGLVRASAERRNLVWFALLAAAGLMLAQAAAYGAAWWGITWGTRFLLPVLPLLAVGLAPGVELLSKSKNAAGRVVIWILFGFGILIQLGGVLVSNSVYTIDLYYSQLVPDIGEVLWSFKHAPLIAHWRLLLDGAEVSPAFVRLLSAAPLWTAAVIGSCLLLIGWAAWRLRRLLTLEDVELPRWQIGMVIVIAAVLPAMVLTGYQHDPKYGADRADLQALDRVLAEEVQPGDVILVYPYLRTTWHHFMNFYRGDGDWYSLPNTFPAGDMASTMALVDGLGGKYSRVWLVTETAAWEPVPPFVEGYLGQFGEVEALAVFDPVDQNLQLRLLLYNLEDSSLQ